MDIKEEGNILNIKLPSLESLKLKYIFYGYRKSLNKEIVNKKGVYFLFDKEKRLLYVGKTMTLRNRLASHLMMHSENRFNPDLPDNRNPGIITKIPSKIIKWFAFIEEKDEYRRRIIEFIYINFYNPIFNAYDVRKAWWKYFKKTLKVIEYQDLFINEG